ncbi:MAG: potassium channel family protein [Bacteroidales bacterium]|nr:potassium channel family protein [Blastochloris sp.]NJO54138.1 potassium channel family protein [Bacteroidales bacterium]
MIKRLRALYESRDRRSLHFRAVILGVDIFVLALLAASSFFPQSRAWDILFIIIAVYVCAEIIVRIAVARAPWKAFLSPASLADMVVVAALLTPFILPEFAVLRAFRTLALVRAIERLHDLGKVSPWFKLNEHRISSALYLMIFVFVVSGMVYAVQKDQNPGIANYVDALYFTVSTLTTTGFGDIVMVGTFGRLLAIIVMIFGIGLFLNLVRAMLAPPQKHVTCEGCGLSRHEPDAAHCRRCGAAL